MADDGQLGPATEVPSSAVIFPLLREYNDHLHYDGVAEEIEAFNGELGSAIQISGSTDEKEVSNEVSSSSTDLSSPSEMAAQDADLKARDKKVEMEKKKKLFRRNSRSARKAALKTIAAASAAAGDNQEYQNIEEQSLLEFSDSWPDFFLCRRITIDSLESGTRSSSVSTPENAVQYPAQSKFVRLEKFRRKAQSYLRSCMKPLDCEKELEFKEEQERHESKAQEEKLSKQARVTFAPDVLGSEQLSFSDQNNVTTTIGTTFEDTSPFSPYANGRTRFGRLAAELAEDLCLEIFNRIRTLREKDVPKPVKNRAVNDLLTLVLYSILFYSYKR